jgi:hypothetical protein
LRLIGFALACSLAVASHAEEAEPLRQVAQDLANIFADVTIQPLDDEKLGEMRGGIASRPLIHTGVVLWDEPRKTLPPQRGATPGEPPAATGLSIGITINR